MPVETTEKQGANRGESNRVDALPASERVSGEHEARQSVSPPPDHRPSRRRRLLIGALGALVLAAVCIFGVPWILASFNTVSTDDAYVNGHVTFVAPRVAGQISRVLVDELLAELDKEPFEDAVAVKRAAVDTRTLSTANAQVTESLAEVYRVRASLGLSAQPHEGEDLGKVPPDLDQTFSSVLAAQADLIQSAAQLGVIHSYDQSPKQMLEQFEKQGDIDRTFARLEAEAPAVKQAEAKLESAKRELAQSELDLRFCDIVAKIDGVITRRNVNPGDYVQVGQNLMATRSLREIWVDANFKETQLDDIRIGQPADLYVDMYGSRHVFKGRVSGFTMGTGSTLALLPAQNATGNFVKVVQRLPVRIDLEGYDPDKDTLFIGTSVVPYVYINKPPTGPDAGKFLQADLPQTQAVGSPGGSLGPNK